MSDLIPRALMVNIWIRLPIRSAVRFRCVSKSWCASLSDPDLINKNLTFSDSENDSDLFVLATTNFRHCFVVSRADLQVSRIQDVPIVGHILLSSCDGLLCFYERDGLDVGLWNPATGENMVAPRFRVDANPFDVGLAGVAFGFDGKNQDYKIVKILRVRDYSRRDEYGRRHITTEAYVYTLRSDCWRKLDDPVPNNYYFVHAITPGFHHQRRETDKVEKFYWYSRGFIVSFDMSDEVFKEIPIPLPPHPSSLATHSVFWLRERSLGMILLNEEKSAFEIWALLEAGVAQSFTHLYTIDWVAGLNKQSIYMHNQYPGLGFWRNRYLFHTESGQVIMCDPSKRETKAINIGKFFIYCCVVPYIASHKSLPYKTRVV